MTTLLEMPQIPCNLGLIGCTWHDFIRLVFDLDRIPHVSCEGRKLFFHQGGLTVRRRTGFGRCCSCWNVAWLGRFWRIANVAWLGRCCRVANVAWLGRSKSGCRWCWTAIGCLLPYHSASLQAIVRETSKGRVHLLQATLGKLANHLRYLHWQLNFARYSWSHLHLPSGDSSGPHEVVSAWFRLWAAPTCWIVARSQTRDNFFLFFLFSLSPPHFLPVSDLVEKSVLGVDSRQVLAAMPEDLEILNSCLKI